MYEIHKKVWFNIYMANLAKRLINYILERRKKKLEKTLESLKPRSYTNSTTKMHVDSSSTLVFSSETEKRLEKMDEKIKNIVKPFLNNPEKLLEFISEHGTKVYKFKQAKFVLKLINEEEGFVTPLKGLKALWLNISLSIFTNKKLKFSLKTNEMFLLRDKMEINVYYLLHQFHKWYGFKSKLPGYDSEAQDLFKENLDNMTDKSLNDMTIQDILSLKEAIARDAEAVDFVIKLSKESSGAQKAHKKMKEDGGAEV